MNKIIYVIALVLGLTISTRINAQETIDLNISQGDLNLLKNLACTGDSSDPQLLYLSLILKRVALLPPIHNN